MPRFRGTMAQQILRLPMFAAGMPGRERLLAALTPTARTWMLSPLMPNEWYDERLAVELGYGDELGGEFHSLNFRTDALNTDIARDAVQRIKQYNAFAGVSVAGALEQLRGDIMYYEFGREASPVLYVHLPHWTHQQERSCPANHCREGAWGADDDARKLDASEHAALLQRVRAAFQAAHADTIDPVMGNDHILRIWWD